MNKEKNKMKIYVLQQNAEKIFENCISLLVSSSLSSQQREAIQEEHYTEIIFEKAGRYKITTNEIYKILPCKKTQTQIIETQTDNFVIINEAKEENNILIYSQLPIYDGNNENQIILHIKKQKFNNILYIDDENTNALDIVFIFDKDTNNIIEFYFLLEVKKITNQIINKIKSFYK